MIDWTPKAYRQLRKVKDAKTCTEIYDAVDSLKTFPDCRNVKRLVNHPHEYRLRVGRHRVLFDVREAVKIIDIQEVKKRDERTY
jgi:mRNA-degrading endonuclease RelE of RelBE toxin-antitoxin system